MEKIKTKIHEYVKKYGIEKCKQIFGEKVLLTIGFNNDPMEFLNLFNDLDVVQSIEEENWTLFRNEKGKNLMIYDRTIEIVFINYDQIWSFLRNDFGLNYTETEQVTEEWLGVVYNLMRIKTLQGSIVFS